jgi:LmbE family N-acetylglucosaminyl deacetylase
MERRDFLTGMLAATAAEVTRVLGIERTFDLNYNNHRMGDVSWNELICRLIFLIRLLKLDMVFCYDPWGHDEENPDHYVLARCVEAACWMAGRVHDYPEQFAAGLKPHAVSEKYYYARRPEITRVVDISAVVDKKVDANFANQAKGPGGHHGSRLRAELARKNQHLPVLGSDDAAADRNYIRSSSSRATASSGESTAWNMPKRSTTSARRPRGWRITSSGTQCP